MMLRRSLSSSHSQPAFDPISRLHQLLGNVISGPALRDGAGKAFQESQEVFPNSGWQNALQVLEGSPAQIRVIRVQRLKSNVQRLTRQTQRQESENMLKADIR